MNAIRRIVAAGGMRLAVSILAAQEISMRDQITAPMKVDAQKRAVKPPKAEPPAEARPVFSPYFLAKENGDIIHLPNIVVQERKFARLREDVAAQDKEISAENRHAEPSALDDVLNNPKICLEIFGGESSEVRAQRAKYRVETMGFERLIIIALADAKTEEEKVSLKAFLKELRERRRWAGAR